MTIHSCNGDRYDFVVARKFRDRQPLGPPPTASSLAVSRSMKSNRRTDTLPERLLDGQLRGLGADGFVRNDSSLSGTPDIAFPSARVAVFVYGCFWHRCPWCQPGLPRVHRSFWKRKFERNRRRDRRKRDALRRDGWSVFSVWECRLKGSPEKEAKRILVWVKDSRARPRSRIAAQP